MKALTSLAVTLVCTLGIGGCGAQNTPATGWVAEFDAQMEREFASNQIPGMAVALVQGNQTIFSRGYGLRDVENSLAVNGDTLFHIASTHKSLNALMIASMVDDAILAWNTPVVEYYEDFSLSSKASTDTVSLVHLLSMSSGIPESAEDQMADSAQPIDVFDVVKDASLVGSPREVFSYSNVSAAIAGYIATITEYGDDSDLYERYGELLENRVLAPIGMTRSTIFASKARKDPNISKSYEVSDGAAIHLDSEDEDGDPLAPSGSLKSSVNDMARYLSTHLNQGVAPSGNRMVSIENVDKTKQVVIENYALGWEHVKHDQTQVIMHTGSYDGYVSVIALVPSYQVGMVLLANSEDAASELTEYAHEILVDVMRDEK